MPEYYKTNKGYCYKKTKKTGSIRISTNDYEKIMIKKGGVISNQTNNQIEKKNNIDLQQKKQSTTNLASKRPIQSATETLDIEPLDEQNLVQDSKQSEKFEIDDPW